MGAKIYAITPNIYFPFIRITNYFFYKAIILILAYEKRIDKVCIMIISFKVHLLTT